MYQMGHSTPETTPEITPDAQRPQAPLKGISKWWRNEKEKDSDVGKDEERQNWIVQGNDK